MQTREQWTNNAEEDRWEATIGPYLAVARFDRRNGRYVAYVDSRDGSAPDHYAPESFSDAEAAKVWCEAEIKQLEADRAPQGGLANTVNDMLTKPEPEL